MAKFEISFQVQGNGDITLPVTALDELIVLINELEIKTFRFSVENILTTPVTLDIAALKTGLAADKADITFDVNPLTIEPAVSAIVTTTITPNQPLLEGDVIDITVTGLSV